MFGFEKLDVWKKAVEFCDAVYRLTKKFPDDERFGLTSQVRRAAVSIASNLAEGSGRGSPKDFAHFVQVGYGSLMEVVSQVHLARRQGFLTQDDFDHLYADAERLARMLSGLRASLQRNR